MSPIEREDLPAHNALLFLKADATIDDVRAIVRSRALPGDTIFADSTTTLPSLLLDYLLREFEADERLVTEISREILDKSHTKTPSDSSDCRHFSITRGRQRIVISVPSWSSSMTPPMPCSISSGRPNSKVRAPSLCVISLAV
jgi:hypothetical protein